MEINHDNDENTAGGAGSTPKEDKLERMEDWRNEHGQPNFEFLQSLVDEGTPQSMEKLRSIAGDLNVTYDMDTPLEELVGKIREATQIDPTNITT